MDSIIEIPNFFNTFQHRQLMSLVNEHNDLSYQYRGNPSLGIKTVANDFMQDSEVFIHRLYNSDTTNGKYVKDSEPYNASLYPIDIKRLFEQRFSKIFEKNIRVVRLSLNIQPANIAFVKNIVCPPHTDRFDQHYSAVYYMNTCNGSTTIFNEKYSGDEFVTFQKYRNDISNNKFTVAKQIMSEKNKCVIFDGLLHHSSRPSTNESRFVFNVNFIEDDTYEPR
jgi:hypothetical protein